MIEYQTERTLAELSSTGSSAKRLTVTKWGNYPAKLDLRIWRTDEEPAKPGKGITLTDAEAATLAAALNAYLSGQEAAGAAI